MLLTPALAAGSNFHVSMCGEKIGSIYKKKYKVEKTKISENSVASQWPFYFRLDMLFDPSIMFKKPPPSPPLALPLPSHRKDLPLPTADATVAQSFDPPPPKERHSNATPALGGWGLWIIVKVIVVEHGEVQVKLEEVSEGWKRSRDVVEGNEVQELAQVVDRLAEIYEKVEDKKQRQMIELEK